MRRKKFEKLIAWHEDYLFGLRLFYEGCELLHGHDEDLTTHYENTRDRIEKSLALAKALLADVRVGAKPRKQLRTFQWPGTTGHPWADDMTKRAMGLVFIFELLYLDRPREKPLSAEEHRLLMAEVMRGT